MALEHVIIDPLGELECDLRGMDIGLAEEDLAPTTVVEAKPIKVLDLAHCRGGRGAIICQSTCCLIPR